MVETFVHWDNLIDWGHFCNMNNYNPNYFVTFDNQLILLIFRVAQILFQEETEALDWAHLGTAVEGETFLWPDWAAWVAATTTTVLETMAILQTGQIRCQEGTFTT